MKSTRLPGKVLMELEGRPLLWYALRALRRSPAVGRVILATSFTAEDDPLEKWARDEDLPCVRGSEEDVLGRFYETACLFPDACYFRATGDNPFPDSGNPGRTLEVLLEQRADYACETGMPVGAVVECFTREALVRCHREAGGAEDREHVTLFMRRSGSFRTACFPAPEEYRCGGIRLTVDYPEDFRRAARIAQALFREGEPDFGRVLDYCRRNPPESAFP